MVERYLEYSPTSVLILTYKFVEVQAGLNPLEAVSPEKITVTHFTYNIKFKYNSLNCTLKKSVLLPNILKNSE